ncbi:MAG TPA: Ig-like domain-containing protein, partial [Gemmataceae bacterium]|nr:Ig-like domain-containing protein [Gemmataceae bacterium]
MNLQLGRTRIFAAVLLSIFGAVSASAQKTTPVVLISVQPNPVVNGSNVTISVTVKPATGVAAPALPSGQVTINATASCAANVQLGVVTLDSSGNGQLMVSTWPCAGAFTVVASYAGDANFLTANSAALIVTVLSQYTQTTTTLASSQNPSTVGQSVTLSATLTYTFTLLTRPSGTITFTDTNTNTVLGSAAVATGSGTHTVTGAFITISNLAPGSYSVQASYSGDNIYAGSTSSIVIQVVQQSAPSVTTTALTVSAGQVTQSTSVTFTATVTSKAGDIPTGPVTFTSDGATTLGVVNLDSTGTATLSISTLAIGTHQIVAAYGGSSTDGASSSSPVSVTVTTPPPAPTTTTLTSSANPVTAGTAITLTATVTSAAPGTPTGSVEFFDGPTLLATAAVDQTGTAVLTGVSLPVGVHQLSAIYSGDSTFAGSQGTGTETVNAPPPASPTTTSISSSANPSVFGQTITFSASVSVSTGVATGSVTFTIGSTSTQVPLDNTGTATLTTAALP